MKNLKDRWDSMSTEKQMKFIGNTIIIIIAIAYVIYVVLTWEPGQLDGLWEEFPDSFRRYTAYRVGKQIAEHFIG